ncbi:hypothetical protein BGX27_007071 [Mortierella sp. AM989]|nr:hypothetical protein BGX27_007071 [Mortierella sp. AM989]
MDVYSTSGCSATGSVSSGSSTRASTEVQPSKISALPHDNIKTSNEDDTTTATSVTTTTTTTKKGPLAGFVNGFLSRLRRESDSSVATMINYATDDVAVGSVDGKDEKGMPVGFSDDGEGGAQHSAGIDLKGERPGGAHTFKVVASLVCVIAGTGTLGMPHAVSKTGWLGIILVILALFMSTTTGIMLVKCLYLNTDTRRSSYEDIAMDSFGCVGYYTSIGVVGINLFGSAVLYTILASSLIQEMVNEYSHKWEDIYIYVIACSVFVWICLVSTKSMKEVAILSIIGAGATIGVVSIVIGDSAHMKITHAVETVGVTHRVIHWSDIPSSLATMAFAYSGNVVYPHVEHTMQYPRQWPKAVWSALTLCCVLYISIAIAGYAAFGDRTESPILNNLPKGAYSMISNILMIIHVLLAAPILLTSLAIMVESLITKRWPAFVKGSTMRQFFKRAIDRTIIIVLTAVVAAVIPYFGHMMDLLGALTTCLLVFVFPIMFYFMLGGMKGCRWWTLLWYLFILAIGIVAMVIGTIDAIKNLIKDFNG